MKITNEFWDFIEKYIPDFTERDDTLRQSELQNYIDGHESSLSEEMSEDEAEDELHLILYNLYNEAISNYTKGVGVECEHCKSQSVGYCRHCGKKLH